MKKHLMPVKQVYTSVSTSTDTVRWLNCTGPQLTYVRRFIENTKGKLTGPLTATELHHVQTLWIKSAQQESYYNELFNLQSKSSVYLPLIRQLHLNLNKDGIICCSGWVHNAPISLEAKFFYLLPQKSRLTELIIKDVHQKHFHSGTTAL